MVYACKVFNRIPKSNIASWNVMFKVMVLFCWMKKLDVSPNCFTFPIVLKSCSGFGAKAFVDTSLVELFSSERIIKAAYKVFGEMVERNVRKLFDQMLKKDVISWNTVLCGYANNEDVKECERLFEAMLELKFSDALKRMLIEGRVFSNDVTLMIVLSVCARLRALDLGKWVHVECLIDIYVKCEIIENALDMFKRVDKKDLITWNTIIRGLNAKEIPYGITFIGVLFACTHMSLIEDGLSCFQSMVNDYSIVPQIEHYGCMVDLLARASCLAKAIEFIKKMPIEAYAVTWANLLAACRVYKNVELAKLSLQRLIELEPKNPANFILLSNIYEDLRRWKVVARAKGDLIEVNDIVVEFYSQYEKHPQSEEIYATLKGLTKLLRLSKYAPDFEVLNGKSDTSC
ncbi:hypothetical protein ACOSQ2_020138 [Xanthoceras sorbifolium]